jgi:hypothetical protein
MGTNDRSQLAHVPVVNPSTAAFFAVVQTVASVFRQKFWSNPQSDV